MFIYEYLTILPVTDYYISPHNYVSIINRYYYVFAINYRTNYYIYYYSFTRTSYLLSI